MKFNKYFTTNRSHDILKAWLNNCSSTCVSPYNENGLYGFNKIYDTVSWEKTTIEIKDSKNKTIYKLKDAEFPKTWDMNRKKIVASRYFSRIKGKEETSLKQVIARIANTIHNWGKEDNYFTAQEDAINFKDELQYILLHGYACFNSPVLFNVGIKETPQTSACFILDVEDTLNSLLQLQINEVNIARNGSGSGVINSQIRSSKSKMSNGGKPSGPLSFIKARDAWANTILSGGVLRRFAKMEILHYWHPDIFEFCNAKQEEELKSKKMGNEYKPLFQNSNFSIRLDKTFWEKYIKKEKIICNNLLLEYMPDELLDKIAESTWECGDPGLQFEDNIQNGLMVNPFKNPIGTNPCAEYIFYPNTSCNLASINIDKLDHSNNTLEQIVKIMITSMDILINHSSYPTKEIKKETIKYRNVGLGFSNLGATLIKNLIPYDSNKGRQFATKIQSLIQYYALKTSNELAVKLGKATGFDKKRTREIITKQISLLKDNSIVKKWNELLKKINKTGLRNCYLTNIAPTGTISFFMGCETTGIEPLISFNTQKQLTEGSNFTLTNDCIKEALVKLKYKNSHDIKKEHLSIFQTAFGNNSLSPEAHINMCAAIQPFVNGGISKTINLPFDITQKEIKDLYFLAYKKGLKCISMYRNGSKYNQVLTSNDTPNYNDKQENRIELPETCISTRHKFSISGHSGYIHFSKHNNKILEIFVTMSREGSTLGGLLACFSKSVSIGLQHGVPLEELITKFKGTKFEPQGITSNNNIRFTSSVIDYIFKYLEQECEPKNNTNEPSCDLFFHPSRNKAGYSPEVFGPLCNVCGNVTYIMGTCFGCKNCGETTGCG